jgi:hypothetical protein
MDMDTISSYVYVAVWIFLAVKLMYHDKRLKRYIDRQYPEEGKIIRLYEWQWYPWSVGRRTIWTLVKKQRTNDPELARLAKKVKRTFIYCIAWLIVIILIDSFIY